jgi:hypothetical protein
MKQATAPLADCGREVEKEPVITLRAPRALREKFFHRRRAPEFPR